MRIRGTERSNCLSVSYYVTETSKNLLAGRKGLPAQREQGENVHGYVMGFASRAAASKSAYKEEGRATITP